MATKTNAKKLTPFEKELIETIKQVNKYKKLMRQILLRFYTKIQI